MRKIFYAIITGAVGLFAVNCGGNGSTDTANTPDTLVADSVETPDTTILADLTLNEVKGPVKEIITIDHGGSDTVMLDSLGYCISRILEINGIPLKGNITWQNFAKPGETVEPQNEMTVVRDRQGLIRGFVVGDVVKYEYRWDKGRLTSFTSEQVDGELGRKEVGEYKYDADGNVIEYKTTITFDGVNGKEFTETYSDYVFDDHGSWISKKVTQRDHSYTVTRKISYY